MVSLVPNFRYQRPRGHRHRNRRWIPVCLVCVFVWPAAEIFAAEPTTAVCTGLGSRGDCRPAPGSPDENVPTLSLPAQQLRFKKTLTLPEQTPAWHQNLCDARFNITYSQRGDEVVVDVEIRNPTCAESFGEYELRLRTRDPDANSTLTSFSEGWSRAAPAPLDNALQQRHSYPIDASHLLQWVKVVSQTKTACTCGKASAP